MNAVLYRTEQEARQTECFERALASVKVEITDAFCREIRLTPVSRMTVITEGAGQIRRIPMADAIDLATNGYSPSEQARIDVLENSDCPRVEAWRRAMAVQHIADHAEDIAEIMAGQAA